MSRGVDRAIRHAVDAVQRYNAELHVLYVVDSETYSSYPGNEYVHEFEGLETALEQSGQDAIKAITDRAESDGVETQSVIRHGVPHAEILQYMAEANIGLTVIGSKNRPGEYRRLLGSVADRIVNMAEKPVTVVKTPTEA